VEDVIGYAHAPWVIWVSTHTTIAAPSAVELIPGYFTLFIVIFDSSNYLNFALPPQTGPVLELVL